ncbi:MAG: choice-of-anchor Q domain-containing protein [Phycisphaerae bacterium]
MIRRSLRRCGSIGIFGIVMLATHAAHAATIFVSTTGSNANDGLSWATSKQTVQAGLQAAVAGDRVWVAAGRYVERITLKAGVGLYGGLAGNEDAATFDLAARDFIAKVTVLDGNELGSVVIAPGGATESCRIDGFTITGGRAFHGGGIYVSSSSPTVVNNRIVGNLSTGEGGGIHVRESSRPLIANNVICGNSSQSFGGGVAASGLPTSGTLARLINNTILGNQAESGSASIYSGQLRMVNNLIAYNSSGLYRFGGGGSVTYIRNNCFFSNVGDIPSSSVVGVNGNFSADPRIADRNYGRVHLQSDSPCIDAGSTADVTELRDFEGQVRIQGIAVDIGADESNGANWLPGPNIVVRVSLTGSDANDGSNWESPKRTVQVAIDAAAAVGGDVWIQAGTYAERVLLRATAHVFGSFAGTESATNQRDLQLITSTLDGQRQGSVVRVTAGFQVSALDGVSIQWGRAATGGGLDAQSSSPQVFNCDFRFNTASSSGGGMYVRRGNLAIVNSRFVANTAAFSGGGFAGYWCEPTIDGCQFSQNSAPSGGGLYINEGRSFVRSSLILGNSATGSGGGIALVGGTTTVSENEIVANTARNGAGVHAVQQVTTVIERNVVARNVAAETGGGIVSGPSTMTGSTITSNLIIQNAAAVRGGGVSTSGLTVAANTIVGNRAPQGGAISAGSGGIESTLIAFNSSGIYASGLSGQPVFNGNCVFGNAHYNVSGFPDPTGTSSNISLDPQFRVAPSPGTDGIWATDDDDLGDLRLTIASPCIDGGNPQVLPPPGTEFDFAGEPRVVDGNGDGQRRIDIGAYEHVPTIAGDFDGDCLVGLSDLATLLTNFGLPDGVRYEDGDFDRDGDVDLADLAGVLTAFGLVCN